ncbi:MAG: rhomboid family intramembrane serine protease [Flavobacteriales bacterium]|nr:rhomboid family intramembrane serine protease [Flavobacteriales bacterium]
MDESLVELSPVTMVILVVTSLVSISAFSNHRLFGQLLYEPFVVKARGEWYRFITHAFVHANWPHLLVNMFVLYGFGSQVEPMLAWVTGGATALPYLILYTGGILFSALPAYKKHLHDPSYRAVGASGAVSAVLFAMIIMEPTASIGFLFFPFPIPAWVFGILYLIYSWYMDKRNEDNVAHDAHFFGALYGVTFMAVLEPGLLLNLIAGIRSTFI